jgi:hypothetical protein
VIGAVVAVALGALVIRGTLLAPTSIGSPTSESDALIRANERLLEMAKWTISTILLLGGALIGLNWYSNEQRYSRDRAEHESRIVDLRKAFNSVLENTSKQYLEIHGQVSNTRSELIEAQSQIMQGLLYPGGEFPEGGYAQRVFELIEGHSILPNYKKRLLDHFLSHFENAEARTSFVVFLGLDYLPEIARAAEKHGLNEEAARARNAHERLVSKPSEESDDSHQPQ